MTPKQLQDLAKIQIEIGECAGRMDSSKLVDLMETHLALIDEIIAFNVGRIIPDLRSGWGPGYELKYLTEEYITKITQRQIGILQATELQDKDKMFYAQVAYFELIEKIIAIEVSKALTLEIKYSNIKNKKDENNGRL